MTKRPDVFIITISYILILLILRRIDDEPTNSTAEGLRKNFLNGLARLLIYFKEHFPFEVDEMEKAFDEFIATESKLFDQTGESLCLSEVECRIPKNKFLELMRQYVESQDDPEYEKDSTIGDILSSASKKTEDIK